VISLVKMTIFDGYVAPGSMPHPFWIPVLLMSCQYGVMGGLFATLAGTSWFFFGGLPPQSATQDFYDYAEVVAGQPCGWFATAFVLGGLRSLHIHHENGLREQLDQIRLAAEDLVDGLENAIGEVERLEHRIAADSTTLTSFMHSLAKLDLRDRASLIGGIGDLLRHGVGATSFVVYLKGLHGLEPMLGVDNGSSLTPAAIAPLAPSLLEELRTGVAARGTLPVMAGDRQARMPHWAPIGLAGPAGPAGVVVYSRLQPSQNPAVAARRLDDLCRVLAVLLSACPAATSEIRRSG